MLLSAPVLSNNSPNSVESTNTNTNSVLLSDESTSTLSESLFTGRNRFDQLAYWNCSTSVGNEQTRNIHLRFWQDYTGFSGSYEASWQIRNEDAISIEFADKRAVLHSFTFTQSDGFISGFSAIENSGANVNCERIGPHFGNNVDFQMLQQDSSGGLINFMQTSNTESWLCVPTSNNNVAIRYQLNSNRRGSRNDTAAQWFVDDQFNLVISTDTIVEVYSDIERVLNTDGAVAINATMKGNPYQCSRS